jgi:hypothetical protein
LLTFSTKKKILGVSYPVVYLFDSQIL